MISPDLAQRIVESAVGFAIITLDAQGIVTSWSPGAEELFGWPAREAIGRPSRLVFTPEDADAGAPEDELRRTDKDGRATDERFHLRQDGSRFWGSGLMMPLSPTGYLKIVRDRTAERQVERRFATLADALPGFVFEADADGHFVQANKRYQLFTGRAEAELLGDGWLASVHPDQRQRASDAWSEAVRGERTFEQTLLFRGSDGEYRCFACRGVPERNDDGRLSRWIGTCIDVEREAQARAALEGLNRSLEHAVTDQTAELVKSRRVLQAEVEERERVEDALRQSQKLEAIGQLTGGVAHDFNNLLTVILGSIDLLRRPELSPERRERYLDSISETAGRAAKLTGQLLAFARRQSLASEAFDIVERVRGQGDVLQTVVGSGVRIAVEVFCDPCLVDADPTQFDTAILNMVVNARDAMDGNGLLTIRIEERQGIPPVRGHAAVEGPFIAVSITDTGGGIAAADLPRIFEPFFTTKGVGRGTGLGLSQVFGFAKQSRGDIMIDSDEGRGATFTLFLPKAASAPDAGVTAPTSRAALPGGPEGGFVLLVEDNQMVGEFAAGLLTELGYDNRWASSGQEALSLIEAEPDRFDIVFTDVVMPGMSGIELAETLRARFPSLPVVLTSGYSHILAAEGTHGFDLLQKPYTAEGLAAMLRTARQR